MIDGRAGSRMPRKDTGEYPPGWKDFAVSLKEQAGWTCIRCGHPHDPATGHTLTVHYGTMAKDEPFDHWWAFWVLCQRCHLQIQHKVNLSRPWVMGEHSEWFKPYVAGWYAFRYLGVNLERSEVEARLPELLQLERTAVLGQAGMTALGGIAARALREVGNG